MRASESHNPKPTAVCFQRKAGELHPTDLTV